MYYIVEIAHVEPQAGTSEQGTPPEDLPVQYGTIEEATEAGKARIAELVQAGFKADSVTFKVLDQHGKPAS
jgi:hypothetical protein